MKTRIQKAKEERPMNEIPDSNFDWVAARDKCSPESVFRQLEADAQTNTERRNELLGEKRFVFNPGGQLNPSFYVSLRGSQKHVRFYLSDGIIHIEDDSHGNQIDAKLTLDNDGECKFKVKGEAFERWQILRMALEDFFF